MRTYPDQLNAIVEQINEHKHSKSSGVLREIVNSLETGVISGILFDLDDENFSKVIDLFTEFRETGRDYAFNTLHAKARQLVHYEE